MQVRDATRADLPAIAELANDAFRTAYQGLLAHDTICSYLTANYSPQSLWNRYQDHPMFLISIGEEVCAFADAYIQDDRIVVAEIVTIPAWRRTGFATQLLDRVRSMDPNLPQSADVVLGNQLGEHFYEAQGFVPGETVQMDMFGEQVVERRWWRLPD